jgi:hypothetical protein
MMPPLLKNRRYEKKRADGRTRTDDLQITNQLLYQLSYVGAHEIIRRPYDHVN